MAAKKVVTSVSSVFRLWAWILLAWSLYRYFLKLPEWADEFIFKPLVFVAPVIWYVRNKEKEGLATLGFTRRNFFTSVYIGLGFGVVFALEGLVTHVIKYGTWDVNPIAAFQQYGFFLILLSLATACTEELLSRGFVFNRLYEKTKNLAYSSVVSSVMFVLLHVPILVTMTKLQGTTLVLFLVTDLVLGIANSLLYYNTGSLVAPILVHIFWNMTVALYL
ncbi:MAG: CPBP family intramembrane metalloprotease [Candidatus Gottesmanbacteria bacterium]|nr:CPBP family intramembrane metalloprotease [Candidatus Gottesmanbacteria bacterium]